MFHKIATFTLTKDNVISFLNKPKKLDIFLDIEIPYSETEVQVLNKEFQRIVTASKLATLNTNGDSPNFDLEAEINEHPNDLYVKCFAIKCNEMNDNGDYFSREELKKAVATFIGVPAFTNHDNKKVENARGKVIYAWWDEERDGISIIARIDAEAFPPLARAIKQKIITGTSMGASVQLSLCSVCHNSATNPNEYCSHIREKKTREVSAKNVKCEYHKNGSEEKCPLCECKKGETHTFNITTKAFEHNYGVKFIENSFVVNPACHSCGVTEIIDTTAFLKKVSFITETLPLLLKEAVQSSDGFVKNSGTNELKHLNEALDKITTVSKSMLEQRHQIDLEFLTDLTKVLSDLQSVTDELTQQGYGRLNSPGNTQNQGQNPQEQVSTAPNQQVTHSVQPTQTSSDNKVNSGTSGVGSFTSPTASTRKILQKLSNNRSLINKIATVFFDKNKKITIPFSLNKGF